MLCFFFIWAAGAACFFSVAVAAITFVLLVAEIGMVVVKFAMMTTTMAEQTDGEKDAEKGAQKPQGSSTDKPMEKAAAELQVAQEPPLGVFVIGRWDSIVHACVVVSYRVAL